MISQGYVGLFIICFAINMIPFLSPSNMVLAFAAVLILSIMGFISPDIPFRLKPFLSRVTFATALLLVQFLGPLGNLWRQIGRCLGFNGIKKPIREQFHVVI